MTVLEVSGPSLGLGSLMIPAFLVADTSAVGGGNRTFEIFLEFSAATHMDIMTLFFFLNKEEKENEPYPVCVANITAREFGMPDL